MVNKKEKEKEITKKIFDIVEQREKLIRSRNRAFLSFTISILIIIASSVIGLAGLINQHFWMASTGILATIISWRWLNNIINKDCETSRKLRDLRNGE